MLLAFLFLVSLVAGRLFEVQGVEGPAYAQDAFHDRLVKQPLPAVRGDITDRHGVALATNVLAYDVIADPTIVKDPARVGAALAPILHEPAADITGQITRVQQRNAGKPLKEQSRYAPLAQRQPPAVRAQIAALPAQDRSGVQLRTTSKRTYPSGSIGANVVGHVRTDGTAAAGLEYMLDGVLKGVDGTARYERAPQSTAVMPTGTETVKEPVDGAAVKLTLDRDIQWRAQEAIAAQVKASDADWGSVIALDVKTGQVYAMANSPTYDPNDYRHAASAAFTDQAVASSFEPGSTSKVMTVASALQEGVVTPSKVFTVPYTKKMSDKLFHDDEPHRVWHPTVTGILAKSSNVGTIQIANLMSPATLYSYLQKFGIGTKPQTGLQGEAAGILAKYTEWSGSQRYTVAFGQGLATSLLQVADVYQTLANGGVRIPPTVVQSVTKADGTPVPLAPRTPVRVVDPQVAKQMMSMMEAVTYEGGTGKYATIPGYRVAGKTGTAQVPGCGGYCQGKYQSSFVGVVPADNPRLVVAVTISVPKKGSHFGGTIAAPVFNQVASFALQTLDIPPSGTTSPKPDFGDVRG
ncbi:peptidoglycan synthetase FtsI [Motilibacter rhizosphaerae]|uniref:Peptidoglycan synthetase FtsI n=1 Tax=Motilibacter rhizosphaerae TaxID=598652 RepID=A0A4Q7NGL1_9ACTN|nr:peptidoglycan synthetase FtsI [Motilibacter rhizosphaerae]